MGAKTAHNRPTRPERQAKLRPAPRTRETGSAFTYQGSTLGVRVLDFAHRRRPFCNLKHRDSHWQNSNCVRLPAAVRQSVSRRPARWIVYWNECRKGRSVCARRGGDVSRSAQTKLQFWGPQSLRCHGLLCSVPLGSTLRGLDDLVVLLREDGGLGQVVLIFRDEAGVDIALDKFRVRKQKQMVPVGSEGSEHSIVRSE